MVEDVLVDETLVEVEPVPFELMVGAFAHDAATKASRANATTVLRTPISPLRRSQLRPGVARPIGPEVPAEPEHSRLGR